MHPSEKTRLFALNSNKPRIGKMLFTVAGIISALTGVCLLLFLPGELGFRVFVFAYCFIFGAIMTLVGFLYTGTEKALKKKLEVYEVNRIKTPVNELFQRAAAQMVTDPVREKAEFFGNWIDYTLTYEYVVATNLGKRKLVFKKMFLVQPDFTVRELDGFIESQVGVSMTNIAGGYKENYGHFYKKGVYRIPGFDPMTGQAGILSYNFDTAQITNRLHKFFADNGYTVVW